MSFDSKMPLSELYGSIHGNNESPHHKSTDISYMPNDEFVELIWEKGQIMMQGQSSKAKKTPVCSNFQYHTPKVQEKEGIWVNEQPLMPGIRLNQDDDDVDMVPWLNYPLDDYCSDLLPEISGVTVNEPQLHNGQNKDPISHSHSYSHSHTHTHTHSISKSSNLFSWSLDQLHNSDPMVRSGVLDIGKSNCRSKPPNSSSGIFEKMMQKQDSLMPNSTSTMLNFSHFSRPAALAKANLMNNEHDVVNNGPQKQIGFVGQPSLDSVKVGSNPFASKPLDEPHCVEKSTTVNDKPSNVVLETVKSNEPVGATSSVCSGNSAERASNELTKNSKRKSRDTEDFECQSQDVEEESLGTKAAGASRRGTGSKRSRAAEVHNLSERRRRDRINEKMHALQELIPNCNKVDKASMLDEAIEYLKTLQLQVQIMSMGSGLCMPSMMFPPGMHPHFSPIGMSYGMGMGMGINGGPPHMFPFHHTTTTQGSRHHVPSPPVYGHPSQGMPMLFPQPPIQSMPMTQISTQPQVADKSLNQPTSVDKKDEGLEAGVE